jgi:hypothetical protein
VVLHNGGDHYVVGTQAKAVVQVVESFGRIATDDRDVIATFASREQERGAAGVLVRVGRMLRLVAGAAVDGRVRREELPDATKHGLEHARRRSGVERDIWAFVAVDARHEHPVTDQRNGKRCHVAPISRRRCR